MLATRAFAPISLIILPVLIWLFAFFRDPNRRVPAEQHVMVSPADGTVSDITQLPHDELLHRYARAAVTTDSALTPSRPAPVISRSSRRSTRLPKEPSTMARQAAPQSASSSCRMTGILRFTARSRFVGYWLGSTPKGS